MNQARPGPPLRALIIEDERPAREYLVELVEKSELATVIGAVATLDEARQALDDGNPIGADIARAAGISKGLLYHYFPSKRDYYVEVVRRAAGELLARSAHIKLTHIAYKGSGPLALRFARRHPLSPLSWLLFATVATLFFVPVVFAMVHGWRTGRADAALCTVWLSLLLALPLADTLKAAVPGGDGEARARQTVDRTAKWAAQTPQMFRLGLLQPALVSALSDPAMAAAVTDEASAIEALGHAPRLVTGDFENIKVTWPGDFALAERLLATRP